MKTKVRTFITVFALAFAGVLNANAAVNLVERNSGLFPGNENLTVLNEKIASFESEINGTIDYEKEALLITKLIADQEEAKAIQKVMERGYVDANESIISFENEVGDETNVETTDFLNEALLMIKQIADQEEAEVIQKVMERGYVVPNETITSSENENNVETTDFREEALLTIKQIADQEEAKAVQKVMERGYVAPNETITSSENENNVETTDFREEALLTIKKIADQEEAKAVQKVMDRGYVVPNETIGSFENEVENETNAETTGFREEALLTIKQIADQEEAKAVQKVMERGYVAPSERINSFENETNIETTDFREEALLMIEQIADQEEAKAVQKVMERGYVVPNETITSFENEVENETKAATTGFREEALLTIKQIADQEEAKAVQKLTVEDKLAETK